MRPNWITGLAVMAVAAPVLLSCAPSAEAPTASQAASNSAETPPRSAIGCTTVTSAGGRCVSMQQHDMRPVETDQGYATEVAWTLSNQCPGTMNVSWNWGNDGEVGQTTLAQGQSADVSCLWNIDGCTGNLQFEYRCAEVPTR